MINPADNRWKNCSWNPAGENWEGSREWHLRTFDEAVELALDEAEEGATHVALAAWRPAVVPPEFLEGSVLEEALERLDETFGDPDGDDTKPTEAMRALELRFIKDLLALYVPGAFENTDVVRVDVAEWRAGQMREGGAR